MSSNADQRHALALTAFQAGKFAEAESICRELIAQGDNSASTLNILGMIAHRRGQHDQAETLLSQAISISPDRADLQNNLGEALRAAGKLEPAAAAYRRVIELDNRHAKAFSNLAIVLTDLNQLAEAQAACKRTIALEPNYAKAHNNLGNIFQRLNRPIDAIQAYNTALRIKPDYARAMGNLAAALVATRDLPAALPLYQRAAELEANNPLILSGLARLLSLMQEHERALPLFERAASLDPTPRRYFEFGGELRLLDRLEEAAQLYEQALTRFSDHPDLLTNYGSVLGELGRRAEALALHDRAIAKVPDFADAHFNRGWTLLLDGNFIDGFASFKRRSANHDPLLAPPVHAQPIWDGSDLHGKPILLHCDYGSGDTIHFVRYAALVTSRGGRVILEAPPDLHHLFRNITGVNKIIAPGDSCDAVVRAELMHLPSTFGTTLETIPDPSPYLHADPSLIAHWSQKIPADGKLRIGLVWSGNPRFTNNRRRSCPPFELMPLDEIEGITLYSLQKGIALPADSKWSDLAPGLTDYSQTAAALANLDLLITVDTSVAHLAGALGRPTWLLLSAAADWRWLVDRQDSPWYPTLRLFRQGADRKWAPVIERVAAVLRRQTLSSKPVFIQPPGG